MKSSFCLCMIAYMHMGVHTYEDIQILLDYAGRRATQWAFTINGSQSQLMILPMCSPSTDHMMLVRAS